MPNRILKESICTSETIDALSTEAEAFFYRLMVQCDDFGRMDARASVIRARCYPLRLDKVSDNLVTRWLAELVAAELIWVYEVDGRAYLQVTTWDKHQQKRAKYSKYPQPVEPDSNCNQVLSDDSNSPREARSENTRSENTRSEKGAGAPPPPANPKPKVAKAPNPAAVEAFRAAANTYPNKALWQSMAEAVGDQPDDVAFWQQVVGAWIAKGYNPQNVAGMFDFFKRRELPAANSATKTPAPVRKYDPTLSPEELALKARIKAHKEQQAQHANR